MIARLAFYLALSLLILSLLIGIAFFVVYGVAGRERLYLYLGITFFLLTVFFGIISVALSEAGSNRSHSRSESEDFGGDPAQDQDLSSSISSSSSVAVEIE